MVPSVVHSYETHTVSQSPFPFPFSHLCLPLWFSLSYSLLWGSSYTALQERDSLFVWQQTRLPLPSLFCVCVCSEVAGSRSRVKRYTRVRSEVLSLYGNGAMGFICTALCVWENWSGPADTELWRSEMLRTHLSLCQFNVSMCTWVGGVLKIDDFLFGAFRGSQEEVTQDPAFLQY